MEVVLLAVIWLSAELRAYAERRRADEWQRLAVGDVAALARERAYRAAMEEAVSRYQRAVGAWHQTIPPMHRGDADARAEVACADGQIRRVREAGEERHG